MSIDPTCVECRTWTGGCRMHADLVPTPPATALPLEAQLQSALSTLAEERRRAEVFLADANRNGANLALAEDENERLTATLAEEKAKREAAEDELKGRIAAFNKSIGRVSRAESDNAKRADAAEAALESERKARAREQADWSATCLGWSEAIDAAEAREREVVARAERLEARDAAIAHLLDVCEHFLMARQLGGACAECACHAASEVAKVTEAASPRAVETGVTATSAVVSTPGPSAGSDRPASNPSAGEVAAVTVPAPGICNCGHGPVHFSSCAVFAGEVAAPERLHYWRSSRCKDGGHGDCESREICSCECHGAGEVAAEADAPRRKARCAVCEQEHASDEACPTAESGPGSETLAEVYGRPPAPETRTEATTPAPVPDAPREEWCTKQGERCFCGPGHSGPCLDADAEPIPASPPASVSSAPQPEAPEPITTSEPSDPLWGWKGRIESRVKVLGNLSLRVRTLEERLDQLVEDEPWRKP